MDLINPMHIATKSSKIDITSEKDTKSISQKLSNYVSDGDIVFLYGDIGIGKTTFIKYFINYLQLKSNIRETEIPSPTFNLVIEYQVKDLTINHYDLYRIRHEEELKNIGLFENYESTLTFVEWPEIIKEKPTNRIELIFNYEENFLKRSLIVSSDYKKEIVYAFK